MSDASWFTTKKRLFGRCPKCAEGKLMEIRTPIIVSKQERPQREVVTVTCQKCAYEKKENERDIKYS